MTARVYVNHGRWVAHCETQFCTGAERVWPGGQIRTIARGEFEGRRYGISPDGTLHCGSCGLTSQVEFPEERKDIERLLARRPVDATRNWFPGETLEDLAAENDEHGVN